MPSSSKTALGSLASLSALLLLVGCGGDHTTPEAHIPGNAATTTAAGGSGTAGTELGCTSAPYCGSCSSCYDRCVCNGGDQKTCVSSCSGQGTVVPIGGDGAGGSTGSGGSSAVGSGGSGTAQGGTSSQGWQELTLTSETFTVAAGDEVYRAQNFQNPIGHDVDIIESESFMTPGSHHMFAFHGATYNADGALGTSTGIEFAPYVHTAQTPQQITTYPAGIGRFLPAGDGIRLQVHYINSGSTDLTASVSLRIRYVDSSQVQYHAAEIFLNDVGISVPPGQSTATTTVAMPYAVKLLGAGSHMHSRAINFDSKTDDGREIYTTTDWNEPAAAAFNPTIDIAAGGSITWSCTWNNTTGQTLGFGESAASNEMCIFSGVYYPAPGGAGITRQCLGRGGCF